MHESTGDVTTAAVIQAVADLAHGLQIYVVAEGVETERELHAVRNLGIDAGQGEYLAPAMTARACAAFLISQTAE